MIGRSFGDYEFKKKIRKSNLTIETITALIHEHMYDRLNGSNNSNDGEKSNSNDRTNENGRENSMRTDRRKERNTKSKRRQITDAENAAHQTGRDNTYAQQKRRKAEIVKREVITRNCADQQNKYNT